MKRKPISDPKLLNEIQEAIEKLASDGLIVDTGSRRFSPRTGRHEIVWAAASVKDKLN
jgi:hypothetical protein